MFSIIFLSWSPLSVSGTTPRLLYSASYLPVAASLLRLLPFLLLLFYLLIHGVTHTSIYVFAFLLFILYLYFLYRNRNALLHHPAWLLFILSYCLLGIRVCHVWREHVACASMFAFVLRSLGLSLASWALGCLVRRRPSPGSALPESEGKSEWRSVSSRVPHSGLLC